MKVLFEYLPIEERKCISVSYHFLPSKTFNKECQEKIVESGDIRIHCNALSLLALQKLISVSIFEKPILENSTLY